MPSTETREALFIEAGTMQPADERTRSAPSRLVGTAHPTGLPMPALPLFGRESALEELEQLVRKNRLVTLTGTGGIGKTRLGIEVARRLRDAFPDGAWLAELAPLHAAEHVPGTIATALRLRLRAHEPTPECIGEALRAKQLLLVLDSCEQVADSVAQVTAALIKQSPVRIIVTSRAPLQAPTECIYHVPPLEVSPDKSGEVDLLRAGGVRCFVERARAARPSFSPDERTLPTIAAICRRLAGMPLAIELAAAQTAAFEVDELAARLHNRFILVTRGNRTELSRHQTVRATVDWTYGLLPGPERAVLRRLAGFAGAFSLDDACAVAQSGEVDTRWVLGAVGNLASKSLVAMEFSAGAVRLRLLEPIRAFAQERLYAEAKAMQQHTLRALDD